MTTYKGAKVDQSGTKNGLASQNSARTVLTDSRSMVDCEKKYILVDYKPYLSDAVLPEELNERN
jgi:hypothetical protein